MLEGEVKENDLLENVTLDERFSFLGKTFEKWELKDKRVGDSQIVFSIVSKEEIPHSKRKALQKTMLNLMAEVKKRKEDIVKSNEKITKIMKDAGNVRESGPDDGPCQELMLEMLLISKHKKRIEKLKSYLHGKQEYLVTWPAFYKYQLTLKIPHENSLIQVPLVKPDEKDTDSIYLGGIHYPCPFSGKSVKDLQPGEFVDLSENTKNVADTCADHIRNVDKVFHETEDDDTTDLMAIVRKKLLLAMVLNSIEDDAFKGRCLTVVRSEDVKAQVPASMKEYVQISSIKVKVGDSVKSNYKGRGRWYSGTVAWIDENGDYKIHYVDGTVETGVKENCVRGSKVVENVKAITSIKVGDSVQVSVYKGIGPWYRGTVASIDENGDYGIHYVDGTREIRVKGDRVRAGT